MAEFLDLVCRIRESSAFYEQEMSTLAERMRSLHPTAEQASRAFERLGRAMMGGKDFDNEGLDGSACVEDWDPDFDPRSLLITDISA